MGTYIVIDRNGGDILRQQIFRLLIVFAPSRHVGGLRRVAQRRVVSRVAVLTGVLAIPGTESIEEGGGIVVVGNPRVADGVELCVCMVSSIVFHSWFCSFASTPRFSST